MFCESIRITKPKVFSLPQDAIFCFPTHLVPDGDHFLFAYVRTENGRRISHVPLAQLKLTKLVLVTQRLVLTVAQFRPPSYRLRSRQQSLGTMPPLVASMGARASSGKLGSTTGELKAAMGPQLL